MATDTELLTPAEAAVVAAVTVRDINRVIDEKILPDRLYTLEGGRRLHVLACPMVEFYFRAAKELTAEERTLVIHLLFDRMGAGAAHMASLRRWLKARSPEWTVHHHFLTIDLSAFAAEADARHDKLAEAREMVVEDPEILSGTPVIRGTRIPVHDIAASVAAGLSHDRIRAAWPTLDDCMIELASIYADASPVRGRPRRVTRRQTPGFCPNAKSPGAALHEAPHRRVFQRGADQARA